MPPLKRFQVLLKGEHLKALREIEQRTGTSMGAVVRLALDEYLSKGGMKKGASRRVRTRRR